MRRVVIAFFVYLVLDNTRRGCSIKAKLAGVERRASPVRRQDVSVRAVALNEGNWEFFSAHSFSLSLSLPPASHLRTQSTPDLPIRGRPAGLSAKTLRRIGRSQLQRLVKNHPYWSFSPWGLSYNLEGTA